LNINFYKKKKYSLAFFLLIFIIIIQYSDYIWFLGDRRVFFSSIESHFIYATKHSFNLYESWKCSIWVYIYCFSCVGS